MDEQMILSLARAIARATIVASEPEKFGRLSEAGIDALVENLAIKFFPEARAAHSVIAGKVAELEDWAFEQSRLHHRLAVENEPLRTEHIASSSAYRELGLKLREQAALAPHPKARNEHHE